MLSLVLGLWLTAFNPLMGCSVEVGVNKTQSALRTTCGYDVQHGYNKGWLVIRGRGQVFVFQLPNKPGMFQYSWDWDHGYFNGREIPVYTTRTEI